MGAREVTTEFFRAKFLHVGLLCLALPTIIIGALYGLAELKIPGNLPPGRKIYGSSIILTFNLLLAFYTFLMFAPPGFAKNVPYLVWYIFGVTILGLIGIDILAKLIKEEHLPNFNRVTRWILCAVVVLVLDYYCFRNMADRLREILWPRGINYLLFVMSIALLVYRIRLRIVEYGERRGRVAVWTMGWCVLGLLYFLTILTFAYAIYPNIPASRGGGDFTDAPNVVLYYRDAAIKRVPTDINHGGSSQPLVLIEESERWLVLADPKDAGGPTAWRIGLYRPQIFSVNREDVATFVYQSRRMPTPKP